MSVQSESSGSCDKSAVTLDLGKSARLVMTISRTTGGPSVHAEEMIDGRVVGTIRASQNALQRALGVVQRFNQSENAGRDRRST